METLKGIFQCPQKLTNVIQTSQNSPWLSLRSLNKWYGVFAPQYYKFSHMGVRVGGFCVCLVLVLGFVGCFGAGGFCLLPPSICSVSFSSTMTWAHRLHGVRTRGKKKMGTGADVVAGAALCCLLRGRMYVLASSASAGHRQTSWQAQHFHACQEVGCTPWRPALAQISWQAQRFAACQEVRCTPWRRLASALAQISWQAQRFAACQEVGMYALASSGAGWHQRRFRGRCSTLIAAC